MAIEEPTFSIVILIARACLSAVFIVSGIHKGLWYPRAVAEFTRSRVPLRSIVLPATVVLHLVGGFGLLAGIWVQPLSLILAVFVLLSTLWVHRFWTLKGDMRVNISRIFLANIAMIGGLLLLAVTGPGRFVLF